MWRRWDSTYNLGQNIFRLDHLLAQFPFDTSETKPDYHHKMIARVASRTAERIFLT